MPSTRADLTSLDSALVTLKLTEKELADKLGYSRSAISGWRRDDAMPYVAAVACDALAALEEQDTGLSGIYSLRFESSESRKSFLNIASAMGMDIKRLSE